MGARAPLSRREGRAETPRVSGEVPGGKIAAAAWKAGGVDGDGDAVVLADHNSPPASSVALLDSVKRDFRAGSRAEGERWESMCAVTGSASKAETSVDVAAGMAMREVDVWTWIGSRGLEARGRFGGVVVDMLVI